MKAVFSLCITSGTDKVAGIPYLHMPMIYLQLHRQEKMQPVHHQSYYTGVSLREKAWTCGMGGQ
jgi:hypothetical protein